MLTTHSLLAPRSWNSTAIPLPLSGPSGLLRGTFTFYLHIASDVRSSNFLSSVTDINLITVLRVKWCSGNALDCLQKAPASVLGQAVFTWFWEACWNSEQHTIVVPQPLHFHFRMLVVYCILTVLCVCCVRVCVRACARACWCIHVFVLGS
jgi:hypothetical protein